MPPLPTGNVTYLLTDIEASTRLWERHPDTMAAAVERHDALGAETVAAHGGVLIRDRGEGDSLFAVFARAADAVAGACALQRRLHAEPWAVPGGLRVRIALHTGVAQLRDNDYYGLAVNRCARLRAIAHGGQTLLSDATRTLAEPGLPGGVTLAPLGEHRLKDLQEPERVFQVCHPDLPADFPPLRSLDAVRNNLPHQLTSFIGRERELAAVRDLLHQSRLVTVTGAGGCGKSRLCLQAVAEASDDFADGVWWVELAPLAAADQAPRAVAAALGLRLSDGDDPARELTDDLRGKRALLVLDNAEHLVGAVARLAETLLRACPDLRLLVSSREVLNTPGERSFRIPSLSVPDPERVRGDAAGAADLQRSESVRLFADRATACSPGFRLTGENVFAVAQVCHRLDGIPLAIELAAARVKSLPVDQIARRLDDQFRLLTAGSRTALPRQQTLKALIDWSHDLLTAPERALLRRLSVFRGGWTLEAAEGVCPDDPADAVPADGGFEAWETLDLLSALVDKSLVMYEERDGAEPRYRLLESVRQYGDARSIEAGERDGLRLRHARFFAAHVGALRDRGAITEVRSEWPNVCAGLEAMTDLGDLPSAVGFVRGLYQAFTNMGYAGDGRRFIERLLPKVRAARRSEDVYHLCLTAGILTIRIGDTGAARAFLTEAATLAKLSGDTARHADTLINLAYVELNDRRFEEARAHFATVGALPDLHPHFRANAVSGLGHVASFTADWEAAGPCYEEALAIYRAPESANEYGCSHMHLNLGHVARARAEWDAAQGQYAAALTLFRRFGDVDGVARVLEGRGLVASARAADDDGAAEAGRYARAALILLGAADALRREVGYALPAPELPARDAALSAARARLSPDAADRAWNEGQRKTRDEADALAGSEIA